MSQRSSATASSTSFLQTGTRTTREKIVISYILKREGTRTLPSLIPHFRAGQGASHRVSSILHSLLLQKGNSPGCGCQYRVIKTSKSVPHDSEYEFYQADFLALNSEGHKILIYLA